MVAASAGVLQSSRDSALPRVLSPSGQPSCLGWMAAAVQPRRSTSSWWATLASEGSLEQVPSIAVPLQIRGLLAVQAAVACPMATWWWPRPQRLVETSNGFAGAEQTEAGGCPQRPLPCSRCCRWRRNSPCPSRVPGCAPPPGRPQARRGRLLAGQWWAGDQSCLTLESRRRAEPAAIELPSRPCGLWAENGPAWWPSPVAQQRAGLLELDLASGAGATAGRHHSGDKRPPVLTPAQISQPQRSGSPATGRTSPPTPWTNPRLAGPNPIHPCW